MKFKAKDIKDVFFEEDESDLKLIEKSGWMRDGAKYEVCDYYFEFNYKNYVATDRRTGSYFTEYYHEYEDWKPEDLIECPEVVHMQEIVWLWKVVP